ncbi:HD family hydrolase [Nocardiopsis sp. L17-MgMaSL7]|uniref:HD domain-containing protein n=1 Tax=Nocardiopsis sp. L17-MgMaSL7 TaxID=1938893 RepID=UPI000D710314|nr:HD domain-containing protein [Nocardiopsis sp. L17-MgMaSL7]PWV49215.1 putative hydrolase of HD superfamily [Nocardiopsis sp. L17-MgMaSL7]
MSDETTRAAHLLYEAGTLKNQRRTGWWMAGVRDPESVAEHSWRTALIASVIAAMEGADPAKAALIAVWHDTGETRSGDINHLGQKYVGTKPDARDIAADQTAGLPAQVGEMVRAAVASYEEQDSVEALCAKDADKLECMVQGIEYRAQGHAAAQRWIDGSRGRIKTKSGQALADATLEQGTLDWLYAAMER